MNYQSLPPLPSGIRSSCEVLSFEGVSGNKKWILLDLDSRKEYRLDHSMLADREIKEGDIPESGPRIIVSLEPRLVAMHLKTGIFYSDAPPPSRFSLPRKKNS
ncbi:hypothetical protein JQR84_23640 (plasmid) [Pseudomonas luteola]|uniref:DUF5440 family protein n=1 Tax=Pseudomonas TaxID=286 RepID=UPI003DA19452